jgi:hypothetical protein
MKCPTNIPLPCTFHFISLVGDAMQASILHQATCNQQNQHLAWSPVDDMIHFTSSRGLIGLSIATSLALHCCTCSHRHQVLALASPPHMVHCTWASNLSFTLATRSFIAKPFLLIFSAWPHETMPCLICNELIYHTSWALQQLQAISLPWHILLTIVHLWTNHLCRHILVHLSCHSITKTIRSFTFAMPPLYNCE